MLLKSVFELFHCSCFHSVSVCGQANHLLNYLLPRWLPIVFRFQTFFISERSLRTQHYVMLEAQTLMPDLFEEIFVFFIPIENKDQRG